MQIGYYKFRDGGPATLRFGVSEPDEDPAIVEDLYDPDLGKWLQYAEVSRYILFEPGSIVAITESEANERTGGHAVDPADGEYPTKPPVPNGPYLD